jgi:hypothetical protein
MVMMSMMIRTDKTSIKGVVLMSQQDFRLIALNGFKAHLTLCVQGIGLKGVIEHGRWSRFIELDLSVIGVE